MHHHSPIRKAAILVSSLDSALAQRLLDELSPQEAGRVERAARDLGPIDPKEQRAVIEEFLRIGPMVPPSEAGGVELDAELAQRFSQARPVSQTHSEEPFERRPRSRVEPSGSLASRMTSREGTPFQFLAEADGQRLAHYLREERPQTIAVVMSYLPQDQAARLLSALPADLQVEAIQRLVDLDQTDQESLFAVEQHLTDWVNAQQHQHQRRSAGVSAVRGILSHFDAQGEEAVLNRISQRNTPLASSISPRKAPRSETYSVPVPAAWTQKTVQPAPWTSPFPLPEEISPQPMHHSSHSPMPPVESRAPTISWEALTRRGVEDWALVLRDAEPELIVLALAGASTELVDRVLQSLPSREAEAISRKLTTLGPTRLRDVEAAQSELAALASRRIAEQASAPTASERLLLEVG